jgi:hypothetical protein
MPEQKEKQKKSGPESTPVKKNKSIGNAFSRLLKWISKGSSPADLCPD